MAEGRLTVYLRLRLNVRRCQAIRNKLGGPISYPGLMAQRCAHRAEHHGLHEGTDGGTWWAKDVKEKVNG